VEKDSSISAADFKAVPIYDDIGDSKTYAVIPGACSIGVAFRNVGPTQKYIEVGADTTAPAARIPSHYASVQLDVETVKNAASRSLRVGEVCTLTAWGGGSVLPIRMGSITGSGHAAASSLTPLLATISITVTTITPLAKPYTLESVQSVAVAPAPAASSREVRQRHRARAYR